MNPRDSSFKFETKLLVAFAIAMLVLGALAVITWNEARESLKAARRVAQTHEVLDQLSKTKAGALLIESSTRDYSLTGDTGHLAARDAAITARESSLRRVNELTADNPVQQEHLQLLRATADERLAILRRIELLRRTEGAAAANAYAAGAPPDRLFGTLREMEEEERRLLRQRDGEQSRVRETRDALEATAVLLLAALLVTAYVMIRRQFSARARADAALHELNRNLERRIEERTHELHESERFARASLDALSSHIAVLDGNGRIIATNLAWREFAEKNGQLPDQVSEDADYLTVCRQTAAMGDETAAGAATLIQDLIDGVRLEGSFEYPCHSPQEQRWFVCRVNRFAGVGPVRLALAHENITARKRAEQMQSAEKSALEVISVGRPLAQILDTIVRNIEVLSPGTLCSILLLDPDGVHLRHGSAPSLPEAYNRAIDGVAIGPSVGSCGTAAYRNEQVIVTDIATDPLWADYTALALPLGLRACWSTPVRSGAGKVLGTFALYYREPRSPGQADFDLIERWTRLAGIAIERKHDEDEIRLLNEGLEQRVAARTAELETSRAEIATMVENLADAIVTIDERGTVLSVNPVVERIFGYKPAELIGHNVSLLMPSPHRADHDGYLQRYMQMGEPRIIGIGREVPGRHKNGDIIPVHLAVSEYRVGVRRFFAGTLRDLRQEKKLNAELHQFRDTLDQAFDCVFIFRPETLEFTYVNKGATAHVGYSEAELLRMKPFDITPDFTATRFRELIQPLVDGREQSLRFETVHRHKDGHDIPVEVVLQYVHGEDRTPLFVNVVRDIANRKRAEAAIQKLTTRLQLANETTGIGVWDFDVVNNGLVWDTGMYKLYGLEPGQFGGAYESWLAGVHPDDAGWSNDAIQAALSDIKPFDVEFRVIWPSGDLRWLKAIAAVHRDTSGKPMHMIGTNLDITDRKQAEQALIVARDAAQFANRAKDSFLATTSHEIRTPLGGLMGMLELLSLTTLNEQQRETLLSARDSGRSLLRILDDLLDWSKIEAGELELSPQPTSIADLVARVVNTYASVASARSLVLEQEVDAGLSPALIVDPLRLSQVLNNFVSNALKFTHKGGVVVRAELLGRGDGAEQVRFSVTDSGIGIKQEVLPRLFKNYGQGSAETARMYGGTGLGLAICRRLADLLGGRIETQSAPGEGSTFSITLSLPVSDEAALKVPSARIRDEAASVPRLVEAGAQHEAPLVLVVDDHPVNRLLLALQLRLLGLRVESAENGEAALPMWRDGRFAVVITDCHMPKMDGYALAQVIRAIETDERRRRTPIIAWTANALAEEEDHCHAAGMDEVLVKPTELQELSTVLSKWLAATTTAPVVLAPVVAGHDGRGGTADAPIDLAALGKIAASAADRAEILGDFMAQARADLAELAAALDDHAACERLAHRMKGACRMVGAGEMEAVCAAMQGAVRQDNPENVHVAHAALSRAMARLEAYLARAEDVNKEKK